MSNSAFQKAKLSIPISTEKGGTGVGSIPDKGLLVGTGSSGVTTISPGASGNVLISDGTSWVSGVAYIGDKTVTYAKLDGDLIDSLAIGASNVDWSLGAFFTKTLTSNTTLTFSNYQLDKNIVLSIDGNFSLSLPASVIIIDGVYDGTVMNYISLHCTNATSGSEEVWAVIKQSLN